MKDLFFGNAKCTEAKSCQRIACMCAHEKLAKMYDEWKARAEKAEAELLSMTASAAVLMAERDAYHRQHCADLDALFLATKDREFR